METGRPAPARAAAPLVDLYELTMAASFLAEGIAERRATFQVACRTLPPGWGYLLAAGLSPLLDTLERLRFEGELLAYLERTGLFDAGFLERLAGFRFAGEVRALPEGTLWFADEPLLELSAPLWQAQIVETAVLNALTFSSLVATKASRCVEAAAGRTLVDFGLRRTHGGDAGLELARCSFLAGFDSTSNVLAGARFGLPVSGTMAHSYVEAFASEQAAFEAFTRAHPDGATLLLDTYDTVEGARRAAHVARALAARGGRLGAVRLDSGDLVALSRAVRTQLDSCELARVAIVASGNLDEREIARLLAAGAPIDGFGVGTRLGVVADAPSLDVAYKLVALEGRPVMKLSPGKSTLPGAKQVWRREEADGFVGDLVALADEEPPPHALPLLELALSDGRRRAREPLEAARARAARQREALPEPHRRLDAARYPVEASPALAALGARLASELRADAGSAPA